jgi:hypothetical protein
MRSLSRCSLLLAASCFALSLSPAAALAVTSTSPNAPLRHLVYSFTYGAQGDLTVHSDQGMGYPGQGTEATSGSGIVQDYNGAMHDQGTITVDILREQPDTGLVVKISEQARDYRKADPATCVIYGTTNMICDPNATINSEELTLLRFLGRNFVDPNKLDAKGHWSFDEGNSATNTTADYTLAPGKNGIVSIQETRVVKDLGGRPATTDVSTTIVYDMNRQIPTTIQEYATRRDSSSTAGMMKTTVQTTLNLVSDSMAKT